jgi:hypothetical protein
VKDREEKYRRSLRSGKRKRRNRSRMLVEKAEDQVESVKKAED